MIDSLIGYVGPVGPVLVLAIRNAYGWLVNSLEDGKIQSWEWQQGLKTLLKLGSLAVLVALGTDFDGIESTALVGVLDALRTDVLKPVFSKK